MEPTPRITRDEYIEQMRQESIRSAEPSLPGVVVWPPDRSI